MFTTLEYDVDRAQYLVANGDDGAFVAPAQPEGLKLGLKHRLGATGRVGELARQAPDMRVADLTGGFKTETAP